MGLASGSNTHAYALQRIGERGINRFASARPKYVRFAPVFFTHPAIAHDADYRALTWRMMPPSVMQRLA
jgi:hypothetical protein